VGLIQDIQKRFDLSEQQAKFVKRHLSLIIAPLFLISFAIIMLPFAFRTDSREFQVDLKGHLTSLQISASADASKNYFFFSVKEHQQVFKIGGLSIGDQALLKTETLGNEVNFSVEQARLEKDTTPIPVLKFSTAKNVYKRGDNLAELLQKSRFGAGFLEVFLIFACLMIVRVLRKEYKNINATVQGEGYDTIVVFVAQHTKKAFAILLGGFYILSLFILPSSISLYTLVFLGLIYLAFLYWYKKNAGKIAWIKDVLEEQSKLTNREKVATTAPKHVKAVEILLKNGGDVNIRDTNGRTPLLISAQKGHVEAIDLLVRNGAKIDLGDNQGLTPLMVAAEKGLLGVVVKLVDAKADVLVKNNAGESALVVAQKNKKNRGTIEFLIKATKQAEIAKAKAEEEAKAKAEAEAKALAEGGEVQSAPAATPESPVPNDPNSDSALLAREGLLDIVDPNKSSKSES